MASGMLLAMHGHMRKWVWRLLLVASVPVCGQKNDSAALVQLRIDSTRIYHYKETLPYLKLEQRHTFINYQPVDFFGFMAGVTLSEKHVLAAGLYLLDIYTRSP